MLKFIKNFLKRLEDANSKSFGDGKLDCCNVNKMNNKQNNNKNR